MRTATPLLVLVLVSWACGPGTDGPSGECAAAADCGATAPTCAGCPELPASLCEEGGCVARAADAVEVRADVSLHRDVAAGVRSFVHVLAAPTTAAGALTCAGAFEQGRVAAGVNVLAAGYKAVEGGSFHPAVNVGRVPEGEVFLLVVATDQNAGEGTVLATGCLAGVMATGSSVEAGLVDVRP